MIAPKYRLGDIVIYNQAQWIVVASMFTDADALDPNDIAEWVYSLSDTLPHCGENPSGELFEDVGESQISGKVSL